MDWIRGRINRDSAYLTSRPLKAFPELPLNPITDRDDQAVLDAKIVQNKRFLDDFRKNGKPIKTPPKCRT